MEHQVRRATKRGGWSRAGRQAARVHPHPSKRRGRGRGLASREKNKLPGTSEPGRPSAVSRPARETAGAPDWCRSAAGGSSPCRNDTFFLCRFSASNGEFVSGCRGYAGQFSPFRIEFRRRYLSGSLCVSCAGFAAVGVCRDIDHGRDSCAGSRSDQTGRLTLEGRRIPRRPCLERWIG